MRIRQIKPGICSNEEIAELGPYAYILFTSLWMIADRDGRFEWRPRRLKALTMPLWDEISTEKLCELLESLCKKGLLNYYEVDGKAYGSVVAWAKHQNPDPREKPSVIPPPTSNGPTTPAESAISDDTVELHSQNTVPTLESQCEDGWVMGNGYMGNSGDVGKRGIGGERENSPPPPPPNPDPDPEPKPDPEPDPDPPWDLPEGDRRKGMRSAKAALAPQRPKARSGVSNHGKKSANASQVPRNAGNGHSTGGPQVDWWPYEAQDVVFVRQSLDALAQELHRPQCDDGIVRQTLDAAQGLAGQDIHALLKHLFHQGKFAEMRSWGLVPLVVADWCRSRMTGASA